MNGNKEISIVDGKVYVVIYRVVYEDGEDATLDTKVFDSEEKATAYIARDYEDALNEEKDEDSPFAILSNDNYGNNAVIDVGNGDDGSVHHSHLWRMQVKTVNYGA